MTSGTATLDPNRSGAAPSDDEAAAACDSPKILLRSDIVRGVGLVWLGLVGMQTTGPAALR